MGEIIRYGCGTSGTVTPLRHALDEIGRNVGAEDFKYDDPKSKVKALHNRPRRLDFIAADVTGLITTRAWGF